MIVVDANVAVKWYVPEPGCDDAKLLLMSNEAIVAPALIRLEVLAAILSGIRKRKATSEEAIQRCQSWLRHLDDRAVLLFDEGDLRLDAIRLASQSEHHLYDCFYLALCKKCDATLFTYDMKLSAMAEKSLVKCELMVEPERNLRHSSKVLDDD